MTGEPVEVGVFGDEAQVPVISGVEGAERHVLQRVEVVVTRQTRTLLYKQNLHVKR